MNRRTVVHAFTRLELEDPHGQPPGEDPADYEFRTPCHDSAKMIVRYYHGVLNFHCARCNTHVVAVRVAEGRTH